MKISSAIYEGSNEHSVSRPLFSVVVTTYNRANLLNRALDSLIIQTEKDWEAVIVDDESRDETYCRILPYLREYSKLIYIRQPHKGEATAKNNGIWSSTGSFITFLDSDDEFEPLHLESRKEALIQNPAVRFLYGGVRILGNPYVPDRFDYSKKVHLKDCVIGGTFFIGREIAMTLEGFREMPIGTDADLFDRVKSINTTMLEIKTPTYVYHHEEADSITNNLLSASQH
jgi:glycosyltransferase involved in cell wall biosynthesis